MIDNVNYQFTKPVQQDELTQFYLAYVGLILNAKVQIIKVAGNYDLTLIQALTLLAIDPNHPPTMQNLATIFCCDASNITGIIDGLEAKGLVSRQEKPGDRRVKVVRLEKAGQTTRTRMLHDAAGVEGRNFLGNLDTDEARLFMKLVIKMANAGPMQKFDTKNCQA